MLGLSTKPHTFLILCQRDNSHAPLCVQPDTAAAILHYYFAALGGDAFSNMALGYRHMVGLGVPRSCWTAAKYYQGVADKVRTSNVVLPSVKAIMSCPL